VTHRNTDQHDAFNPLHAAYYADCASLYRVAISDNVRLARDTYRVRFDCPEMARRMVPGQFVMMRLAGCNDPLLGRPLALYDTVADGNGRSSAIDIVYLAMGKMTRRLAHSTPGEELDVWGPLGNGFPPLATDELILVAGGIGQTPFVALGREYLGKGRYGDPPRTVRRAKRVTLCYGVRTADLVAGLDDFAAAGVDVRLASDDGTIGHHGLVTNLLCETLDETQGKKRLVVCCGPEPMMKAAAGICSAAKAPCLVSLETPMACGIGICFSCVAKVRPAAGATDWDWKRTCVEGPVFDAERIEW
jgi:dihydroorotate dehydrogenase electron transfer subunit